jgi:hypothetical protein
MINPLLVTSACIILICACSSITVKSDYDPDVDFSSYKTYHWMNFGKMNDDDLAKNPLLRERIITAVDEQLKKKNFILSESDEVDFVLIVYGLPQENVNMSEWGGGYRYDTDWDHKDGHVDDRYNKRGTLVLDMVDKKDNKLIWRGLGTCILRDYSDPEDLQKSASQYAVKVLSDFPPEK